MDQSSEWVTAQEVAGKEDMPTSARRAKDKLELLSQNFPEKKRLRKGTKATEYHISILPSLTIKDLNNNEYIESKTINTKISSSPLIQAQTADEMERVPFYNVQASAGFGTFNQDVYAPDDYIGLSKQ
ncbi:hypothetical protein PTQ27_04450 [Mannheimia sp. AT1]|uniref:HTH Mu-type domain-containing protein n=1 Tax=Mannheimia cairinae TaxID=3025936 RepID=A0ABT5MNG5_9PAST|nr:hypothetical protein [Mannheimia cairinae]MDD0823725.1 hypothetical protein [Mannheimia cairinae]MDD0825343.1 hypothetical protein [Mannheimia cairinae]